MVKAEKTAVKDGCWIAEQCKLVGKEITDQSEAKLQGFVMESASANRAAFPLLHADNYIGPLWNLQSASHTLSLLLKDLDKRMPWVHNAFELASIVSHFFQSSTKSQGLLDEYITSQGYKPKAIPSHCETGFGSKYIVLDAVADVWSCAVGMISSPRFRGFASTSRSAAAFKQPCQIEYGTDENFNRGIFVRELCKPIVQAIAKCEADKSLLSRMLPMIITLTAHSSKHPTFSSTVGANDEVVTVLELFDKRLTQFYCKPSMSAAFLLDPLNFEEVKPGECYLPFTQVKVQKVDDAIEDIHRLGGDQRVLELQRSRLSGFTGLDRMASAVIKECTFEYIQEASNDDTCTRVPSVTQRLGVWRKPPAKPYPALASVAEQYLSMHATSCAAERNLSVWGRAYDKCRSSLKLSRADKMIFLHFNGKLQQDCTVSMSEPFLFEELAQDEALHEVVDTVEDEIIDCMN
jgi:hypothetical protein